jgi:hypothetical protein
LVVKREQVAVAIVKHEEVIKALRNREADVDAACLQREELIREVDDGISGSSQRRMRE